MKSYLLTSVLAGLLPFSAALAQSPEERGLQIARLCDEAGKGYSGELSAVTMELHNTSGDKQARDLTIRRKELPSEGDRSMLLVVSPADVKGTKLLTWGYERKEDDQWLYLPAMKRVKRINAKLKSGSFMGSEFSFEDFSGKEVDKYKHKYLRDDKVNGRAVWVLEQTPKDEDSGYSREIAWIDQEYKAPLKIEFYDRKGEKLKTAEFSGYRKIKSWWRPSRMSMANIQTRKKSVMLWKKRDLMVSFNSSAFDSENLKD